MESRSPFPGMDPYLEWYWGDVHASLATYAKDALNERLPAGLVARMQERVYIESPLGEGRGFYPDVHVVERSRRRSTAPAGSGASVSVAEPEILHLSAAQVTEPYIEIRDAKTDGRVVTTIEVVSETNKRTKVGRKKYLQKQREVLRSETNLVEIDLLRGGRPVTLALPELVRPERRTAYHACVRRAAEPDELEYYALPLRERLPAIRIPLRPSDDDVLLDLQALVDEAYRKGRYAETIDYTQPPRPPLKGEDSAWAAELLRRRK
jgi:hypothetical protein